MTLKHTVKLPKLGDTVDDVVVLEWLVEIGTPLNEGTPVLLVETAKVETEVVSPVAGKLQKKLVDENDEVSVGAALFIVDASER